MGIGLELQEAHERDRKAKECEVKFCTEEYRHKQFGVKVCDGCYLGDYGNSSAEKDLVRETHYERRVRLWGNGH
jgi:hypothetical protein